MEQSLSRVSKPVWVDRSNRSARSEIGLGRSVDPTSPIRRSVRGARFNRPVGSA